MNLALWLQRNAQAFRDRPSIALGATTIRTFSESALRAAQMAAALRERFGMVTGDRVALFAANDAHYAEILYAIWWAGLCAVPINAKLHSSELKYILDQSGAKLVFTGPKEAATTQEAADGEHHVLEIGTREYEDFLFGDGIPLTPVDLEDPAWLFYTSGTTGKPKGAMLTHRNLLAMCTGYFACIDHLGPRDSILHAAPMSHGSGLYILPHLACGSCQVIPESGGFDPLEIATLLEAHQNVSMFAAPTMVNRLTRFEGDIPTRQLKAIIYGGAPMYVNDALRALSRFGPRLVQIYGQGESPMTITCLDRATIANTSDPRHEAKLGSVGRPYPNVEVAVVDDEGKPVSGNTPGEIIVKGDNVMKGYWNNPKATATSIRDGWLYTGDVGRFDDEGHLNLVDRSKDLVISGGTNIYPREVEEVLLTHPRVQEVSVIGRPDPEWGEIVVAYIVGDASPEELDQLCLDRIARFKRPKAYVKTTGLPKNNYGKILKTALREEDGELMANGNKTVLG